MRLALALILGGAITLIGGYFIVTSSGFLTGVVLPGAGGTIDSELKASEANLRPLSGIELKGLSLTPNQEATLVTADRIAVGYDLGAIIGGKIVAHDLVVEKPVVELVVKADGGLNLDPILASLAGGEESTEPAQVDLQRLKIVDGVARVRMEGAEGQDAVYEVRGLSADVDRLANGNASKLTLKGELRVQMPNGEGVSELSAQLDESVTLTLSDALLPVALESMLAVVVNQASGMFADFQNNQLQLDAKLADNRLDPLTLTVSRANQVLGKAQVSGPFDMEAGSAELQFSLSDVSADLLNQFGGILGFTFGTPVVTASGGVTLASGGQALAVDLKAGGQQVTLQNQQAKAPSLNLAVDLAAAADLGAGSLEIPRLVVTAQQGANALLDLNLSQPLKVSLGTQGPEISGARAELTVPGIDLAQWQVLLGPAAAGRIAANFSVGASETAGKSRVEVVGKASATGLARGERGSLTDGLGGALEVNANLAGATDWDVSELKLNLRNASGSLVDTATSMSMGGAGTFTMKSALRLANPSQPSSPSVNLGLEGTAQVGGGQAKIESFAVSLPATGKVSKNQLDLSGNFGLGSGAGFVGDLNLYSAAADVTPLMDFLDGLSAGGSDTEAPSEPASSPQAEPAPMELPVERLTATAQLDQLHLREIAASEWRTHVIVEKQRIQVDPLQLTMNGAPIKAAADLDLSVPGYRYQVDANTQALPAGPLIGSLQPAMKGLYDGDIDVNVAVKGAGVTGVNLKQHLNGNANLAFKGANIELFDFWKKFFLTPVALVLRVPDLLDSPIQGVNVDTAFADGVVDLNQFRVQSPAFQVTSQGKIPIADDLMQSALGMPVDFALKKETATAANLVDNDAEASEDGFVNLPAFVAVEGTVGEPKTKIDKVAVGKLFIRNVAGLPESVVGKAGDALGGLNDLVTGKEGAGTAAGKVIDGVGTLLGGEKGDKVKNVGGALRGLFNRKKDEEK